jgi:hypothetical protein
MSALRARRRRRRGTTIVETAFVLPVFLAFMFAIFLFGHALMVQHMLRGACREAARAGATDGVSTAEVTQQVKDFLEGVIDPDDVTVLVRDASAFDDGEDLPESSQGFQDMPAMELSSAEARQLFVVRVEVDYDDVSIVNVPFLCGAKFSGMAFMRHE